MSLAANYHQTKSADIDIPLDDFPSSLEIALNGHTGTLKPRHSFSKNDVDSGFLDPEAFRRLSISTISGLSDDSRIGRPSSYTSNVRFPSRSPAPPGRQPWKAALQRFWQRNRGLWLVSLSQLFGASMNVTTRLLETEGDGMHPIQVLFARMILTTSCCCFYMWYTKVPYFPLGMREVRWLLVLRSLSGFFGIFGMYYSLLYLPISEATVITFLGPAVAGFGSYLILGEPFTRVEQIGSFVSLLGVVLIAHPTSFIHFTSSATPDGSIGGFIANSTSTATSSEDHTYATPTASQRLSAIGVALIGVLGGAGALISIKWIGKRAHPLISVNYFSAWCLIVSTTVLSISTFTPPGTPFHSDKLQLLLPSSLRQWGLLLFLGACGFLTQFMMTEGLIHEKGNRATNMVYTNMLFALLFDKLIFGTVPDAWSVVGSGLILGSAVYVAMQKGGPENPPASRPEIEVVSPDEEMGMLQHMDESNMSEDGEQESERTLVQDGSDDEEFEETLEQEEEEQREEQEGSDEDLLNSAELDHRTQLP